MPENEQEQKSNPDNRVGVKCPRCGLEQKPAESCASCGLGLDYQLPEINRGEPAPIDVLLKDAWKLFKLRFPVLIVISIIYNLFMFATNFDAYFKK